MYTLIMTASPRDKRAETETLEHGLHYRKDSPTRSVFYSPTDSLLHPHPLMIRLEIRLLRCLSACGVLLPPRTRFSDGARKGDDEINPRARMGLSHHLLSLVRPNVNLWSDKPAAARGQGRQLSPHHCSKLATGRTRACVSRRARWHDEATRLRRRLRRDDLLVVSEGRKLERTLVLALGSTIEPGPGHNSPRGPNG